MAGVDAVDLMLAPRREFGVDISDIRYDRHFAPEVTMPFLSGVVLIVVVPVVALSSLELPWLIPVWVVAGVWAMRRTLRKQRADTPTTVRVRDLVKAVQIGRWTFQY